MTQGLELRGAVLGKGYRLGRRLDTDDTSAYEGTHERLPGRFIIRVFPPESLLHVEASSRIQRGARVASLLRDPHAVQVLDCSVSGEVPAFVVMERVPGRSLAEVMADDGMLPLSRVVELVESLAAALAAGHHLGLVHGDIRPAHVILPTSGQPAAKLSGFGWAKELRAGARLPSPSGYLAPEQQLGQVLTLDERTDQYGLAALAYDMIGACLPFSEDSQQSDQSQDPQHSEHRNGRGGGAPARKVPPALSELVPGIPRAVDEVLRRALSPTPPERFPTTLELAVALRAAATSTTDAGSRRPAAGAREPERAWANRTNSANSHSPLGATPDRSSDDKTEELELSNLSLVSGGDLPEESLNGDDEDRAAERGELAILANSAPLEDDRETAEVLAADGAAPFSDDEEASNDRDELNGEDAQLVLGATTSAPGARDDAKTQIARSPFFEGPHETTARPAEEDSSQEQDVAAPRHEPLFPPPRRGVPTGRPAVAATISSGDSGRALGTARTGPTTRAARTPHKTQPGIGPALIPPQPGGPSSWTWVLDGGRWTFAAAAAVGLAAIVGTMVWVSRGGTAEESLSSGRPPMAPVAPPARPAPAPAAAPAPPPSLAVTSAPVPGLAANTPGPSTAPSAAAASTINGADPPTPARPQPPPARAKGAIVSRMEPLPAKPPAAAPSPGNPSGAPSEPAAAQAARPTPQARRPPPAKGPGLSSVSASAPPSGAGARAPAECSIRISSRPWAEVWVDGKNTGRKTPIDSMKVPCGTRKLELKRPDKDLEQMEMLEVVPGKPYRGSYELE